MNKDDRFCVYEHIRNDNGQCFYVGKGTIKRAYSKSRNEHHDRIVNEYGMTVKIIKDGLTQSDAYQLERQIITDYVFNKGYGIDISGYNNKPDEQGHLTNHTFGGDGSYGMVHTEEWKRDHSKKMSGENNPMYGVSVWDFYSDQKAKEIKEKISNSLKGSKNPMYGISPKERMTEETYHNWKEKHKILTGENNPNYHNDTLKRKYEEFPELKMLLSRPGKQNGRAKPTYVYDLSMNFIRYFDYIGECCEWLNIFEESPKKINSLRTGISNAIKNGKPYKNFLFFDHMIES